MAKKVKRFEVLQSESTGMSWNMSILRDKHTGVEYLFVQSGYGGGLTPLLDKEGRLVISQDGRGVDTSY